MDGQIVNRRALFAAWHPALGSRFDQAQVDGLEDLLDAWDEAVADDALTGLRLPEALAYIVAGVHRETGGRYTPVREGYYLAPHRTWTDKDARAFVARQHYRYAKPVSGTFPLDATPQTDDKREVVIDNVVFYGRGRIQNTWLANLLKLGKRFDNPELPARPDILIEDSALDARVTVIGHIEGLWSHAKLATFFGTDRRADPLHARTIVNCMDVAQEIAATYRRLLPGANAGMIPAK